MTRPARDQALPTRAELTGASAVIVFRGPEAQVWSADGINASALARALRDLADAYDGPVDYRTDDPAALPPPEARVGIDYWNGRPVLADEGSPAYRDGMDTDPQTPPPATDTEDTGTHADAPPDEWADSDTAADRNDDAGADITGVPDGDVSSLSTATLDTPGPGA